MEDARDGRGAARLKLFPGIGCQIESGGTSAPYRSTGRRVCRMFKRRRPDSVSSFQNWSGRILSVSPGSPEQRVPLLPRLASPRIKEEIYIDGRGKSKCARRGGERASSSDILSRYHFSLNASNARFYACTSVEHPAIRRSPEKRRLPSEIVGSRGSDRGPGLRLLTIITPHYRSPDSVII